jgi:hypothetical protein
MASYIQLLYNACSLNVPCLALGLHLVNDHVKDFNSAIVDTWMWSKQIMQALCHKSYDDTVSMPIKGSAKIRRVSCVTCILAVELPYYSHITVLHIGSYMQLSPLVHLNRFQLTDL